MLPAAIEELLRLTSPVQCLARTLTRDTTAHGLRIPGGRKVLLLYGSANRDPRVFGPNADEFDILRRSPGGARGCRAPRAQPLSCSRTDR
jgi:cytochrome P450